MVDRLRKEDGKIDLYLLEREVENAIMVRYADSYRIMNVSVDDVNDVKDHFNKRMKKRLICSFELEMIADADTGDEKYNLIFRRE